MPNRSAAALGEIIRQPRELAELSIRQSAELAVIANPYHEALVATVPRTSWRTSRTESSARGSQTGSRGK